MKNVVTRKTVLVVFAYAVLAGSTVGFSGCVQAGWLPNSDQRADKTTRVEASAVLVRQEYDFQEFSALDVSFFHAEIEQGPEHSIVVEMDENLAQYVEVSCSEGTLLVGLNSEHEYSIGAGVVREIRVVLPSLVSLVVSSAGSASLVGVRGGGSADLTVSGVSSVTGDISAETVSVCVEGVSEASLVGACDLLQIEWSGHTADLGGLAAADVSVIAHGIGSIVVNANATLDVEASGLVQITYHGNPDLGTVTLVDGATLTAAGEI